VTPLELWRRIARDSAPEGQKTQAHLRDCIPCQTGPEGYYCPEAWGIYQEWLAALDELEAVRSSERRPPRKRRRKPPRRSADGTAIVVPLFRRVSR
jgi:hypothetical protein